MQVRIKKIKSIFFITAFILVYNLYAQDNVADAVVRVLAERNGKTESSSGFIWQSSTGKKYIVTCLHGVVGSSNIYYNAAAKKLKIVKVDKESDIALLEPIDPKWSLKDLPALTLAPAKPSPNITYRIYGFPAGVTKAQGDKIEFSDAQHLLALKDYLPSDVLNNVTSKGFPQSSFKTLRVSSGITPGHSGAPIINPADNIVIGIGSGGLSFVGFRRVNWAVPADFYLPEVEKNGQAPETVKGIKAPKESNYGFSVSSGNEGMVKAENNTFYGTYTIPLAELFSTLDKDLQDEIVELEDEYNYDFINNMMLDIYSDVNTGATIAVPAGMTLQSDGSIFRVSDLNNDLVMYIQIVETASLNESFEKMQNFDSFVMADYNWTSDLSKKEQEPYEEEGFWASGRFASVKEFDEEYNEEYDLHWLTADYSIEYDDSYSDFLGVAVIMLNLDNKSEDDEILYQELYICSILSGFAIE